MSDDDLIRRGDALQAIDKAAHAELENGWGVRVPITLEAALTGIARVPAATTDRSANRVTYDNKGNLDEIVTDAGVHLEDLGGNRWFLGAARSDGTEIRVWFRGKVTMIEDDAIVAAGAEQNKPKT